MLEPERKRRRKSRWDVVETPVVSKWKKQQQSEEVQVQNSAYSKGVQQNTSSKLDVPVIDDLPLTNEVLDILLPSGYEILEPPKGFEKVELDISGAKLKESGYMIPEANNESNKAMKDSIVTSVPGIDNLEYFKEEDAKYFGKLLDDGKSDKDGSSERQLAKPKSKSKSDEELKEKKFLELLLKIKNGSQHVRKVSLRQLTENANYFGPKILFNNILPILMEPSLSDRERHLLVKIVDRLLFKLQDTIRPHTGKILKVISPLLVDENHIMRLEAKQIVANLAKAAGLNHVIQVLAPNIESSDEHVRHVTTRTFAIVACALGIQSLVPFLKALCNSKKSWLARQAGAKIIQQIAFLSGCGVLPYLNLLVDCLGPNLNDDNNQVRRSTANALSQLAEASNPYGIESFEQVLEPLWKGIKRHRGSALASYLRCLGNIIPLMDEEYAGFYSNEAFKVLQREFASQDDDMRRTVLKVSQQCILTEGLKVEQLRKDFVPAFLKYFWNRRSALDNRISKLIIETTSILVKKVGIQFIIGDIIIYLKDESEFLRKMCLDTICKIFSDPDVEIFQLNERIEKLLIDGILVSIQKITPNNMSSNESVLKCFEVVMNTLDIRVKPLLPEIVSIILYRIKDKSSEIRQQATDLIARLTPVLKSCGEFEILSKLSKVLYESLGEVYPDVLGSILYSLKIAISTLGVTSMNPSIDEVLPSLTPILRNRHEKVQENVIDLIGLIAQKAPEYIPVKEWMRICFELLDLLKSPKILIRRSANRTFGYIAKAIGPQEVLSTLLNNLRVQERQQRVCTAVAIGIVAETCSPFTVIPAIMNEYRTPENNVQNGVLKAMTFMFEYIGDLAKDYAYSVVPLLEDALTDRDLVHRQTAATVVKHMAIGCMGLGLEDVFVHFLNLLLPNLYETSPHVIERIVDGIDGVRNNIGVGIFMNYVLSGLFHPARKVRTPYWKIYNNCYVQNSDAMVPYYPKLDAEESELDVWI